MMIRILLAEMIRRVMIEIDGRDAITRRLRGQDDTDRLSIAASFLLRMANGRDGACGADARSRASGRARRVLLMFR